MGALAASPPGRGSAPRGQQRWRGAAWGGLNAGLCVWALRGVRWAWWDFWRARRQRESDDESAEEEAEAVRAHLRALQRECRLARRGSGWGQRALELLHTRQQLTQGQVHGGRHAVPPRGYTSVPTFLWARTEVREGRPAVNGHTGVLAIHDPECWCEVGGWPCNRGGLVWSCCGQTTRYCFCTADAVRPHPEGRRNELCCFITPR